MPDLTTNPTVTPSTDYPSVAIGGASYQLKPSLGATYRMEKLGINVSQMQTHLLQEARGGRAVQLTMKILAAFVAPYFRGAGIPLESLPEYLADLAGSDAALIELSNGVVKALSMGNASTPAAPPAPDTLPN
jgi:hypothetical protein